jgi:PT repeat
MIITANTGRIPAYEFATNTTTVVGSPNNAGGAAVGAVLFRNTPAFNVTPPNVNGALSFGIGNPIVFDRFGNRTQTPTIRKPLRFRAVTDASASNFNTFNTAASHVAGIAALMLQLKGGPKSLTPQQIIQYLERSAVDMDDPFTPAFDVGFDDTTGYGFVDALAALDLVAPTNAPTKAPTKKPTKAPTKSPTKAPSKAPTDIPTNLPTEAPIKNQKCGLLRLSIFCPFSSTGCSLFERIFKIGGC